MQTASMIDTTAANNTNVNTDGQSQAVRITPQLRLVLALMALLFSAAAFAAAVGGVPEWDGPFQLIGQSLTGPVAFWGTVALLAIGCFPLMAGGELGNGMARFMNIALFAGVALAVLSIAATLYGNSGALI